MVLKIFLLLILGASINTSIFSMRGDSRHRSVGQYSDDIYTTKPQLVCQKIGMHAAVSLLDALTFSDTTIVISADSHDDGSIKVWQQRADEFACIRDIHTGGNKKLKGLKLCPFSNERQIKFMAFDAKKLTVCSINESQNQEFFPVGDASIIDACWVTDQRIAIIVNEEIVFWDASCNECSTLRPSLDNGVITRISFGLSSNQLAYILKTSVDTHQSKYSVNVLDLDSLNTIYKNDIVLHTHNKEILFKDIGNNRFLVIVPCGFYHFDSTYHQPVFVPNEIQQTSPFVEYYDDNRFVRMEVGGLISLYDQGSKIFEDQKVFGTSNPSISAMKVLSDGRIIFSSTTEEKIYITQL